MYRFYQASPEFVRDINLRKSSAGLQNSYAGSSSSVGSSSLDACDKMPLIQHSMYRFFPASPEFVPDISGLQNLYAGSSSSVGSSSLDACDNKIPLILCHECGKEHMRLETKHCPIRPVLCNECGKHHSASCYDCPNRPCKICYKEGHTKGYCPCLWSYERGEDFDKVKYEIVCRCNMPFDADNWLCDYCNLPFAKLNLKRCIICHTVGHHITFECPKDTEQAAAYKLEFDATSAPEKFYVYLSRKAAAESQRFRG